jgi:hypothetical protein
MLRARVIDPAGPAWWRVATLLAGFGLLPVALPFGLAPSAAVATLAIAWMFWARMVLPALRPRDAEIAAEPGAIRISRAGVMSQRIAARDVCAASSATTERGVSIALVRGVRRDRPIVIEVATREDAAALRRALGVGARGFGLVSWPSTAGWGVRLLRAVAGVGWTAMALAILLGPIELALGLALPVVPLSFYALAWALSGPPAARATVPEQEQAAAHARSAAERAVEERVVASDATLAPLARVPGEDSRAWLERVDAMAASLVEDEGYRRIGLDPADLRDALADPDALPAVRAIAARVLARVAPDEARQRIGDALAVERDADTRARIRVALEEDVETAARGLDRFERS